MSTLPDLLVKELDEIYDFTFNVPEGHNKTPVETTLDEQGLHVYGSGKAVVEFLMLVGHAVGAKARVGAHLNAMIDLTDNAEVAIVNGDVEVQLPKFLVSEAFRAAKEDTVAAQ